MPDDRDETTNDTKTQPMKVYISDEARRMLDEMGRAFFPGRPRVQSQTVEKIIRERYDEEKRGRKDE